MLEFYCILKKTYCFSIFEFCSGQCCPFRFGKLVTSCSEKSDWRSMKIRIFFFLNGKKYMSFRKISNFFSGLVSFDVLVASSLFPSSVICIWLHCSAFLSLMFYRHLGFWLITTIHIVKCLEFYISRRKNMLHVTLIYWDFFFF